MSSSSDKRDERKPTADVDDARDEPFVRRWARRKQEARAQPVVAREAPPPAEPAPAPLPEKVLTDADMPPLESLSHDSDFSVFMSAGVSEALRRQALRKLFLLPGIGERFPLDSEYYDCHGYEPLGNIITHDMREEMEREARKLKESAMEALRDGDKNGAVAAADADVAPLPEENAAPPAGAPDAAGGSDAAAADAAPATGPTIASSRGKLRKRAAPKDTDA